jgi:hypothetical protein
LELKKINAYLIGLACSLALSSCVQGTAPGIVETAAATFPAENTLEPTGQLLAATNTPAATQETLPTATQEITVIPTVEAMKPTPEGYPTTPEDVVYFFLTFYQEDPNQMFQYVSPGLQAQIPAGGIAELLQFEGVLEGFVLQSGSSGEMPGTAVVSVALQVNGQPTQRSFYLVTLDNLWMIDFIEIQ